MDLSKEAKDQLENIPRVEPKYPGKLCISISLNAQKKVQLLREQNIHISALVRKLLDEFLETIDFKDVG
jgi:hypothetical protein